jgi:hypothetical protein
MIHRVASLILLVLLTVAARAQDQAASPRTTTQPSSSGEGQFGRNKPDSEINLPDEMRSRMAIERADNEHRKILDAAKQLDELSVDVAKRFRETTRIGPEEIKKLATIEKLAKKILNGVAGEEVSAKDGNSEKLSLSDAVDHLSAAAANIDKNILTSTRFVVSAAVVADSNDVIHLTQFIRHAQQ